MGTNSPKSRDFFITINKGAKCYDEVEEILKELNIKLYALITHDKDVLEDLETGTIKTKEVHKHLVIELKNPITFNSAQNHFPGAHIVMPKYKKSAYQYLLHNSTNSKEKYQYDFNEIITNNREQVRHIIESESFELFYENQFVLYWAQGIRTAYQFSRRFGLNVYKQYWRSYIEVMSSNDPQMLLDIHEIEKELKRNEDLDLPF